jgi:hydrophobe/amphiphile efflux-3 (HAE3) family protein
MASIAALPVLIGLSVDYAIQYQARYDEALEAGPPRRRRGGAPGAAGAPGGAAAPAVTDDGPTSPQEDAAVRAASVGGPVIATAALASALGFLVLLLSPVPMVRGFGALVVGGVGLALVCALTVGTAALVRLGSGSRPERSGSRSRRALARFVAPVRRSALYVRASALRGELLERGRTALSAALRLATTRPRQVLAVGLALALLGVVADTQTRVVSDVRELVPEDMQALKDVRALTETTGVAGEVDVTVTAEDLFRPEVVRWMDAFEREALAAHGYRSGKTCVQDRDPPELCPGFSLTDLLRAGTGQPGAARAVLDAVPRYFSQAVISDDRRTANIAFGIRLMPLERQKEVIDDLRQRLETAPPGVTAAVAGAPVLVAEGNAALASPWRRLATLLFGLAAVFAVLLAVRRRVEDAAVPLIPIALAVGWSALVLFLLRIPLNPLSAALGGLVIAISTEFGVLLSARYGEERAAGFEAPEALRRTFESTGAAVLASGATAIAGFAALIFSDITMLRDFGIVTVVDLTVSLLGVMIVLPAALVWAEEHGPFEARDLDPRRWATGLAPHLRAGGRAVRARLGAGLPGRRSRSGA